MPTPPDLQALLAKTRQLVTQTLAGGPGSFESFQGLLNHLFNLTILKQDGSIKLFRLPSARHKAMFGGWNPQDPLPLNDGHYLRVSGNLYLASKEGGGFLKVENCSYQYQLDQGGQDWVFRYDYLRDPANRYPAAHMQIRGNLSSSILPEHLPLNKIHFPTGRITIEAVIRLLAEQFEVRCNQPQEIWRPILAESEREFLKVHHRPLSGPER